MSSERSDLKQKRKNLNKHVVIGVKISVFTASSIKHSSSKSLIQCIQYSLSVESHPLNTHRGKVFNSSKSGLQKIRRIGIRKHPSRIFR